MGWTETTRTLLGCALAPALLLMSGCTALAPRESPLPQDGPNLVEVYRNHLATEGVESRSPRERMPMRPVHEAPTLHRTDLDPLQQRFQRLPNPDLVMHVFPHLARGRYPVPGYVTVFPMYERVEYAMPGEVAPRAAALSDPKPLVPPGPVLKERTAGATAQSN